MTDVTQYSTAAAQKILEQDAYIERVERMVARQAQRIVQLEAQLAAVPVSTLRRYYAFTSYHLQVPTPNYTLQQFEEDDTVIGAWLEGTHD